MTPPKDLTIVTGVYGDRFKAIAELTIPRAEAVLGQRVEVITDCSEMEELKLLRTQELLSRGPVLWVDADILFRSWHWPTFYRGGFCAALDHHWMGAPGLVDPIKHLCNVQRLFNTGLWFASPAQMPVFALAYEYSKTPKDRRPLGWFYDQLPMNLALHNLDRPVNILPDAYNVQLHQLRFDAPPDGHALHVVGSGGKLERIQWLIEAIEGEKDAKKEESEVEFRR